MAPLHLHLFRIRTFLHLLNISADLNEQRLSVQNHKNEFVIAL